MHIFDYSHGLDTLLTPEITGLLTSIHEYRGKQDLFFTAKADVLESLLEVAKIQSTEASNRIEGISTSSLRLMKLLNEKVKPKNRTEYEIAGYRDVLATIHESHDYMPLSANLILQLHRDLYSHLPDGLGGHWKISENVITESDADGNERIRFRPLGSAEIPFAMDDICASYRTALGEGRVDPLLVTAVFILDFLCIHPFSDGNGRMSRLLTLMLLYQSRYVVGKYISLEMLIEKSKETYYETLQDSSDRWHENANDPRPFVCYLLGVILKAYREFEERIANLTIGRKTKGERIRFVFESKLGKITKRDIMQACPDISMAMVEKTLKTLLDSGFIQKIGQGKGASYVRKSNDFDG